MRKHSRLNHRLLQVYTLATFRETLRCYPAVPIINKIATTDVSLPATRFIPTTAIANPAGSYDGDVYNSVHFKWDQSRVERISVHIPAGSNVTIDVLGLQMNRESFSVSRTHESV
jgi:hypothetical protein